MSSTSDAGNLFRSCSLDPKIVEEAGVFLWGARAARPDRGSPPRTFYFRLLWTNSQYQSGRRLAGSDSPRPRRTHFVQSNSDFARAAQTNFSPSIPSRLRYRASRHQMSITRTSAGNSPSLLIAASSLADSKLGR